MSVQLSPVMQQGQLVRPDAIPMILKWYEDYQDILFDDFYSHSSEGYVQSILQEIADAAPYYWVIEVEREMAGVLYLTDWYGDLNKRHSCQIHGLLDRQYHRRGIGKAIGSMILNYLFDGLKVYRIEGWLDPGNEPMLMMAKNFGFKLEGVLRGRRLINDQPRNELLYALIRPDYYRNLKLFKETLEESESDEQKKEKK
jgi:RimJ/RimL family protein N-acetyltransferase